MYQFLDKCWMSVDQGKCHQQTLSLECLFTAIEVIVTYFKINLAVASVSDV
jgi:hypothetical protein